MLLWYLNCFKPVLKVGPATGRSGLRALFVAFMCVFVSASVTNAWVAGIQVSICVADYVFM